MVTSHRPRVRPDCLLLLTLRMSWPEFCNNHVTIKNEFLNVITHHTRLRNITVNQICVVDPKCSLTNRLANKITVQLYMTNQYRQYDRSLSLTCGRALVMQLPLQDGSFIKEKLIDVQLADSLRVSVKMTTPSLGQSRPRQTGLMDDPGVRVAFTLGAVIAVCCLVSIALLAFSRRKARTNLMSGSLNQSISVTSGDDSIQLSSIGKSLSNSGLINFALDLNDPPDPTNPMNVLQLAKFCSDEKRIVSEFQNIPNRVPRLSVVPQGEEDKNRYANVLPLPHTRVKLFTDSSEPRSTYINANYVTGPDNECQYYIATQGPMEETVSDFWTMVWQQEAKVIIMLTQVEEDGQARCAPYWPELTGKCAAQKFGDYLVELKHKEVQSEYIVSKLELHNLRKIEHREIVHYWCTCWPSRGQPEPISLVKLVLDTRPAYEADQAPVVVHCSPGTGRTCTLIALDLCMRQFESRASVDVMRTVHDLRQERAGAIQNKEQYSLIYQAVNEYASIVVSPAISAASSATTLHALLPNR